MRRLEAEGFTNLLKRDRSQLDLMDEDAVLQFFLKESPDIVILAAAKVGGIKANNDYPVEFLLENLRIQNNVIRSAYAERRPQTALSRKLLHLSEAGAATDSGKRVAERSTGANERSVRDRQDRRDQALPGVCARVRREVHLGHADEPLRA